MKYFKSLIIILLLLANCKTVAQVEESVLDRIDFNDTTMINNDFMWETIAEYITTEQHKSVSYDSQMYNMILATDDVLSRSYTSYTMYKAVYQYLIYGFFEMKAYAVVDYMMTMPYLQNIDTDQSQYDEIKDIASQYERVRIGDKASDIQYYTIKKLEFTLSEIKAPNIIIFFWSYSCPHCRDMIKELGNIKTKHKDVAVVTICVSGEINQVKRLLRKSHLSDAYNICDGLGWNSPIVNDYAVEMTPSMFLLDDNMIIVAKPFDIVELNTFLER